MQTAEAQWKQMARVSFYHLHPLNGVGQLPEWCLERGDGAREHDLEEFEGMYLSQHTGVRREEGQVPNCTRKVLVVFAVQWLLKNQSPTERGPPKRIANDGSWGLAVAWRGRPEGITGSRADRGWALEARPPSGL